MVATLAPFRPPFICVAYRITTERRKTRRTCINNYRVNEVGSCLFFVFFFVPLTSSVFPFISPRYSGEILQLLPNFLPDRKIKGGPSLTKATRLRMAARKKKVKKEIKKCIATK